MSVLQSHACESSAHAKRDAEGKVKETPGCVPVTYGLFRSEDACTVACTSSRIALASELIKEAARFVGKIRSAGLVGGGDTNYRFFLHESGTYSKDFMVMTDGDSEDVDELKFRNDSKNFAFRLNLGKMSGVAYATITDLFYHIPRSHSDPWTVDDYIAFVKLLSAGAAAVPDAEQIDPDTTVIVDIGKDFSSIPLGGNPPQSIYYWPWFVLSRGRTYYEARGFMISGIPNNPRRNEMIRDLQETSLAQTNLSFDSDFLNQNGLDTSTTLRELASTILDIVRAKANGNTRNVELEPNWMQIIHDVEGYIEDSRMVQCDVTPPEDDDAACSPRYQRRLTDDVRLDVIGRFKTFIVHEQKA